MKFEDSNTSGFDTLNFSYLVTPTSITTDCWHWVIIEIKLSHIEKKTYFLCEYSLKFSKQTVQKRCPQSAFCNGSFKANWQIPHTDSVGNSSTKSKSFMLTGSDFEAIFQQIS